MCCLAVAQNPYGRYGACELDSYSSSHTSSRYTAFCASYKYEIMVFCEQTLAYIKARQYHYCCSITKCGVSVHVPCLPPYDNTLGSRLHKVSVTHQKVSTAADLLHL